MAGKFAVLGLSEDQNAAMLREETSQLVEHVLQNPEVHAAAAEAVRAALWLTLPLTGVLGLPTSATHASCVGWRLTVVCAAGRGE